MSDKSHSLSSLWAEFRSYIDTNIEYARLTAAEKLAILLTTVALAICLGVVVCLFFFFISIAVVYWIATALPVALAYTIMAAFYAVVLAVVFILRKPLIIDPISKFISKLFLR